MDRSSLTTLAAFDHHRLLEAAFGAAPVGITVTDADGRFVLANAAAHRIYGHPPGTLVGQSFLTIVTPDQRAAAWEGHLAYIRGDGRRGADIWTVKRPDGSDLSVLVDMLGMEVTGLGRCRLTISVDMAERERKDGQYRLLAQALGATANGVVMVDARAPDMPIVYANAAFIAMSGYAREEVLGRNCRFLQREDRDQPALEDLRAAMAAGHRGEAVLRNYRRDGASFLNRVSIEPVRDDAGILTHFIGISQDVTVEYRAARLERLQNGVAAILARADTLETAARPLVQLVGETLDWQFAALWLADRDRDSLRCVAHWSENPVRFEPFAAVTGDFRLRSGTTASRQLLDDGAPLWVDDVRLNEAFPRRHAARATGLCAACAVPIRLGGRTVGALEIFATRRRPHDAEVVKAMSAIAIQVAQLTDRAAAQAELRRSEAELRTVLDAALEAIVTIDAQGILCGVNAAFTRIMGYEAHEVIGRNVSMLMPEPHRAGHDGYLANFHRSGVARIIGIGREVQAVRKDGRLIDVHLGVTELPAGSSGGRFVGTLTDITERKRLDAQLREAQKMEAVGQLTGGIAHDFNNLLAIVSGNLELLAERLPPDDGIRKLLQAAVRAADRGGELTGRLLAFARRQPLLPAVVDLRSLAGEAVNLLRRTLPRAIDVTFQVPDHPVQAEIDAGQMENALLNLGLNARDAMAGGGRLRLSVGTLRVDEPLSAVAATAAPGLYAMVEVADDGTGMAPEIAARIFDPFFTTKPAGQGTGLGLSMVYGFVRQSGGYIVLDSAPGRGTAFRLLFPAVGAAVAEKPASRRVLLVEDMADVRATIAAMLETLGYAHLAVADAETALAQLDRGEVFDLLLTDIGLPGAIDGLALVDLARTRRPSLRIVTMTGYADRVLLEGGLRRAQHPHLKKPFRRAELARVLEEMFSVKGHNS